MPRTIREEYRSHGLDLLAIYTARIPTANQEYPIIRAASPGSISRHRQKRSRRCAWPGFEIKIYTPLKHRGRSPSGRPWQLAHTIYAVFRFDIADGQYVPAMRYRVDDAAENTYDFDNLREILISMR